MHGFLWTKESCSSQSFLVFVCWLYFDSLNSDLPTYHIIIYSAFYSEPVSNIKLEFLYQNSRLGLMRNDISKKHKYPPWRCNILLLNDFRLSKFISTDHHAEQKITLFLLWSEEGAKKHQSFAALFVTQKWTWSYQIENKYSICRSM